MTKRRCDWDQGDVGSCKLKRRNDAQVRPMLLSSVTDKTPSLSSLTQPSPPPVTLSVASSAPATIGLDEKALKAVDQNRQMWTQNLGDIHERVCRETPFPESLVNKIVTFHLGQMTMSMEALTQFYLFLESRFRRFAHALNAFQSLGAEDREILMTNNAPYYFQLYLSRYINAGDGLAQVQALLGNDVPKDLRNCDTFLTLSFRYFASATKLFSDPTSTEMFKDRASTLKSALQLDNERKIGQIAGCLVFYKEPGNSYGLFDSPTEISRAYEWALRNAALSFEPHCHWGTMTNILQAVGKLKHMVHFYSSQSNIRDMGPADDLFANEVGFFEDDIILDSYADGLSLTSMPHPATAREEEAFWMARQLTICESRAKNSVNLGEESLHEAAMFFILHDDAPLSDKFLFAAFAACLRRAHLLLQLHHEYSDVTTSRDHLVASFRYQLECNVPTAASFAFAVAFDEMTTARAYPALERLMGDTDQKTWNEQYAFLSPTEATQNLINVDRQTNLSFLGLPPGLLHNHLTLVAKLREYFGGSLPNDLVNLIQLALLWKTDTSPAMALHHSITLSARLSERYLYHLADRFDQAHVSPTLLQQLFAPGAASAAAV